MNLEQALSDLGLGSQRWFRTAGTLLGVLRSFALCHACALPFHFRVAGRYVHNAGPKEPFEIGPTSMLPTSTFLSLLQASLLMRKAMKRRQRLYHAMSVRL